MSAQSSAKISKVSLTDKLNTTVPTHVVLKKLKDLHQPDTLKRMAFKCVIAHQAMVITRYVGVKYYKIKLSSQKLYI